MPVGQGKSSTRSRRKRQIPPGMPSRLPAVERMRQVAELSWLPPEGPGFSAKRIGERLGLSERHVFDIRVNARNAGLLTKDLHQPQGMEASLLVLIPDAIHFENLAPEHKAMIAPVKEWFQWLESHDLDEPPPSELIERCVCAFGEFYVAFSGKYLPSHWPEWVGAFFTYPELLLNTAPRHAKSELCSVWIPLFLVASNRNVQIIVVSQTIRLAQKFSNKIAWHLEFNNRLTKAFGRFVPEKEAAPWRPLQGELLVRGRTRQTESGDLTVQIRGAEQQILGMEADIIIGDDVVSPAVARSKTQRESLAEYWMGDVMSRLSPAGRACMIGQRVHLHDLYGELAKQLDDSTGQKLWHHIVYPAVLEPPSEGREAKVLWPEEWSYRKLMRVKARVTRRGGSALWETRYQQNPAPAGSTTVERNWIDGDDDHRGCLDLDRAFGQPATTQQILGLDPDTETKRRKVRVMSLDPPQERAGALLIADIVEDRELFWCGIIEIHRLGNGIQDVIRMVMDKAECYECEYLVIEINAAQRWFLQDPAFVGWYRRQKRLRIERHATGINKQDPDYGTATLGADFEMGRIRIPHGDPDARAASALLVEEATQHPFGEYDDQMMAIWFPKFNLPKLRAMHRPDPQKRPPRGGFHIPPRLEKGWAGFTREHARSA